MGAFGLVNRWGLAELHGQLLEWCADQWHRDPLAGAAGDGSPLEGPDPGLQGNQEQDYRLLRGGSWINDPHNARAAFRNSNHPGNVTTEVGVRPGCFSPSTLHRQSRCKGFQREHKKDPDPMRTAPARVTRGPRTPGDAVDFSSFAAKSCQGHRALARANYCLKRS